MNQEAADGDKGMLPDCHPQLYFYQSMLKIGVVSQDLMEYRDERHHVNKECTLHGPSSPSRS